MPGSDGSKDKIADINDIPETEKSEPITNNSKDPPIINAATNEKNKNYLHYFGCVLA